MDTEEERVWTMCGESILACSSHDCLARGPSMSASLGKNLFSTTIQEESMKYGSQPAS